MANKLSKAGIELIKKFEGVRLNAYKDSGGTWTIGYGHTGNVTEGQTITKTQANTMLKKDLERFEGYVNNLVKVELNQNQFDALVSFTYNVGPGALEKSTLLKKVNQNEFNEASEEFNIWVRSNGQVTQGLVNRRKEEQKLFLQPVMNTDPDKLETPKTTNQLAQEVIEGEHGNGKERKKNLGDKFEEVQKRVNDILIDEPKKAPTLINKLADEVIQGIHGSGRERMIALGDNYAKVQAEVTRRLRKK